MTSFQDHRNSFPKAYGKSWLATMSIGLPIAAWIGLAVSGAWFLSDSPSANDWRHGHWVGKCVVGQPAPALVTRVEPTSDFAWVAVNDGMKVRLPFEALQLADCGSADGISQAGSEELMARSKAIMQLEADLKIDRLRLDIAKLRKEYTEVIRSTPGNSVSEVEVFKTQQDIRDAQITIDLLNLQLEKAQIARQIYDTINSGSDRSK
jgi:hypothetical protein